MNFESIRIRIYELKLEREKFKLEKNRAVKIQNFAEAANYRDLEKKALLDLLAIQSNIVSLVNYYDFRSKSIDYFLELNELLLEFHPMELKRKTQKLRNLPEIETELIMIWNSRSLLFMRVNEIIQNEYTNLIKKRGQFIQENNIEEAESVRKTLMGMGEIIWRLNNR
ncbi:MAG: hypothetical protein RL624_1260 [Bacteroidota bacterium]|jgi:hypothetical protein